MGRSSTLSRKLAYKTIAVGSGKGGTGKSTTALNLALYYGKCGIRTALFDLDPLSNVGVILDVSIPAEVLDFPLRMDAGLTDYLHPVFPNLDLIFPGSGQKREKSAVLRDLMFGRFSDELDKRYQILILDLPAGIGNDENLSFLPFVNTLLVVTNPEPTAHVSSGGYIKAALEINGKLDICLWHNRYRVDPAVAFNTRDVIGNYNRFAPPELVIDGTAAESISHIAFVPHDRALNLLLTEVSPSQTILTKLGETVRMIKEHVAARKPTALRMDRKKERIMRYFTASAWSATQADLEKSIREYLERIFRTPLSAEEIRVVSQFSSGIHGDPVYRAAGKLEKKISGFLEESDRKVPGLPISLFRPDSGVERDCAHLIRVLSRSGLSKDPFLRNLAGLSLFTVALYRLSTVKSVSALFYQFFPRRKTASGGMVRDRNTQIMSFFSPDRKYHDRYFNLIKTLFPVVMKQVLSIARALDAENLLFTGPDGGPDKNVYLRLLMDTVHDTVHSGLGVFPGLRFNAGAAAMKTGAEKLYLKVRDLKIQARKATG